MALEVFRVVWPLRVVGLMDSSLMGEGRLSG